MAKSSKTEFEYQPLSAYFQKIYTLVNRLIAYLVSGTGHRAACVRVRLA